MIMRYDEFRERFQDALREARIFSPHLHRPAETLDTSQMSRRWEIYLHRSTSQNSEPFHISTKVSFDWDAVNAARAATCEEDLLTELIGRKQRYPKTQQPWTRVDIALYATLPYGSTAPMPDSLLFGPWTSSVGKKLDKLLAKSKERKGQIVAVTGGGSEVVVEACSSPDGTLFLRGVSVSGFSLIRIPRVWDDPVRRSAEKDIDEELTQLAGRFEAAINEWTRGILQLASWIRYSPPPPGTRPAQPWFEDGDDEESKKIH
jgi:hypothetical protein